MDCPFFWFCHIVQGTLCKPFLDCPLVHPWHKDDNLGGCRGGPHMLLTNAIWDAGEVFSSLTNLASQFIVLLADVALSADACVIERGQFGGVSVIGYGGIHFPWLQDITRLVVVNGDLRCCAIQEWNYSIACSRSPSSNSITWPVSRMMSGLLLLGFVWHSGLQTISSLFIGPIQSRSIGNRTYVDRTWPSLSCQCHRGME